MTSPRSAASVPRNLDLYSEPTIAQFSHILECLLFRTKTRLSLLFSRVLTKYGRDFRVVDEGRLRYTPATASRRSRFRRSSRRAPSWNEFRAAQADQEFRAGTDGRQRPRASPRPTTASTTPRDLARHPRTPRPPCRHGRAPSSPPTAGPTSTPPASSSSITRTRTTTTKPRSRRRKKPWRYRWPDDVRDEVLARLLELNATRAEQERLAGLQAASKPGRKSPRKAGRQMRSDPAQETLL